MRERTKAYENVPNRTKRYEPLRERTSFDVGMFFIFMELVVGMSGLGEMLPVDWLTDGLVNWFIGELVNWAMQSQPLSLLFLLLNLKS